MVKMNESVSQPLRDLNPYCQLDKQATYLLEHWATFAKVFTDVNDNNKTKWDSFTL